MKTANIKKGIVTTIIGSLVLGAAGATSIIAIVKWDFNGAVIAFIGLMMTFGAVLLFSPDTIVEKFKKSDKI